MPKLTPQVFSTRGSTIVQQVGVKKPSYPKQQEVQEIEYIPQQSEQQEQQQTINYKGRQVSIADYNLAVYGINKFLSEGKQMSFYGASPQSFEIYKELLREPDIKKAINQPYQEKNIKADMLSQKEKIEYYKSKQQYAGTYIDVSGQGISIPQEDLEMGIESGKIQPGGTYKDISGNVYKYNKPTETIKETPFQQFENVIKEKGVPVSEVQRYQDIGYTKKEATALAQTLSEGLKKAKEPKIENYFEPTPTTKRETISYTGNLGLNIPIYTEPYFQRIELEPIETKEFRKVYRTLDVKNVPPKEGVGMWTQVPLTPEEQIYFEEELAKQPKEKKTKIQEAKGYFSDFWTEGERVLRYSYKGIGTESIIGGGIEILKSSQEYFENLTPEDVFGKQKQSTPFQLYPFAKRETIKEGYGNINADITLQSFTDIKNIKSKYDKNNFVLYPFPKRETIQSGLNIKEDRIRFADSELAYSITQNIKDIPSKTLLGPLSFIIPKEKREQYTKDVANVGYGMLESIQHKPFTFAVLTATTSGLGFGTSTAKSFFPKAFKALTESTIFKTTSIGVGGTLGLKYVGAKGLEFVSAPTREAKAKVIGGGIAEIGAMSFGAGIGSTSGKYLFEPIRVNKIPSITFQEFETTPEIVTLESGKITSMFNVITYKTPSYAIESRRANEIMNKLFSFDKTSKRVVITPEGDLIRLSDMRKFIETSPAKIYRTGSIKPIEINEGGIVGEGLVGTKEFGKNKFILGKISGKQGVIDLERFRKASTPVSYIPKGKAQIEFNEPLFKESETIYSFGNIRYKDLFRITPKGKSKLYISTKNLKKIPEYNILLTESEPLKNVIYKIGGKIISKKQYELSLKRLGLGKYDISNIRKPIIKPMEMFNEQTLKDLGFDMDVLGFQAPKGSAAYDYGDIFIRRGLSKKQFRDTLRHEAVHFYDERLSITKNIPKELKDSILGAGESVLGYNYNWYKKRGGVLSIRQEAIAEFGKIRFKGTKNILTEVYRKIEIPKELQGSIIHSNTKFQQLKFKKGKVSKSRIRELPGYTIVINKNKGIGELIQGASKGWGKSRGGDTLTTQVIKPQELLLKNIEKVSAEIKVKALSQIPKTIIKPLKKVKPLSLATKTGFVTSTAGNQFVIASSFGKQKPEVKTIRLPSTKTYTELIQLPIQKTNLGLSQKPINKLSQKPSQMPMMKLAQKPMQKLVQKPAQKMAQKTIQKLIQKPMQKAPMKSFPRIVRPPYRPPRTPPIKLEFKFKGQPSSLGRAFNVFAKSKGKWKQINIKPLTRTGALFTGATTIDKSLLRTFKLGRAKGTPTKISGGNLNTLKKFRTYKIVKGKTYQLPETYIERKGKSLLDTIGEIQQISLARQLKSRSKYGKKKRRTK